MLKNKHFSYDLKNMAATLKKAQSYQVCGLSSNDVLRRQVLDTGANHDITYTVKRDGIFREMALSQIVTGDIVALSTQQEIHVPMLALTGDLLLPGQTVTYTTQAVIVNDADVYQVATQKNNRLVLKASLVIVLGLIAMSLVPQLAMLALSILVSFQVITASFKTLKLIGSVNQFTFKQELLARLVIIVPTQLLKRQWLMSHNFLQHAGNAEIPQPILG